jgi:ribose transport system ATP-binding protein
MFADDASSPTPYVLEMLNVRKSYGAVRALRGVNLRVRRGSIHAILGENGAGKSTLIEILAGNVAPDAGTIRINGEQVTIADAGIARRWGVSVVHQHLSLAPTVSVAENLYVGRLPGRAGFVDVRALHRNAEKVLKQNGIFVDPGAVTGALPLGLQQQIEIARAISGEARVLALDEPTSSLSVRESKTLYTQLRRLRAMGATIIVITHRIDDALQLADFGTAIRDGQWIGDFETSSVDESKVIQMMIGRPLTMVYPERRKSSRNMVALTPILRVQGVRSGTEVKGATLHVGAGEIVGLYGLVGAGRSELAECLFGLYPRTAGEVAISGNVLPLNYTPREALKMGLALLPEDRNTEGLFPSRSITDNICAPRLWCFGKVLLRAREMEAEARRALVEFAIRGLPETPVERLSGGNQQKVLFARWRATLPKVFIVDEPTRGVDVGTKTEIYRALRDLASLGVAILLISSEMPEVLGMSDRIYVMAEGRIVDEYDGSYATEERLLASSSSHAHTNDESRAS